MTPGQSHVFQEATVQVIRIAAALYVASEAAWLTDRDRIARVSWTAACCLYLLHVYGAFQFFHHWSQTAAYRDTARQTAEMFGTNWGGGTSTTSSQSFGSSTFSGGGPAWRLTAGAPRGFHQACNGFSRSCSSTRRSFSPPDSRDGSAWPQPSVSRSWLSGAQCAARERFLNPPMKISIRDLYTTRFPAGVNATPTPKLHSTFLASFRSPPGRI